MSRRKQSNPKSIKVSADSPETEGTDKDADVRDDVLSEMGEKEGNNNSREEGEGDEGEDHPSDRHHLKSTHHHHHQDPHTHFTSTTPESADSPDHIDVVTTTTCQSPGLSTSSPPPPLPNHHHHRYHHHYRHHNHHGSSEAAANTQRPPIPSLGSPSLLVKVEKPDDDQEEAEDDDESESQCRDRRQSRLGSGSGSALSLALTESSATQGLVKHLQLPSDVLYMKEVEVTVHGTPTPSWMICSAIPLPKGSSLGPFSGHMVSSDNIRVGNLILEFHSKTGHVVLVNVAGQSGAWLALLRPAVNQLTRNALVYLEGGKIWCEIVSDVEIGMELRATFVFDLEDLSVADREMSLLPVLSPSTQSQNAADKTPVAPSPPSQSSSSESTAVLQQPSPGHAALIYGCPFCGVRFSSPRTLQGHLSYYCSKKKAQHIVSPRPRSRRDSDCPGNSSMAADLALVKQEVDNADSTKNSPSSQQQPAEVSSSSGAGGGSKRPAPTSDNSSSSNGDASPPPLKVARVEGGSSSASQCPLCSYYTDKPASLNRHMRIHNRPPEPEVKGSGEGRSAALGGPSGASGSPCSAAATFCKECNIQFSTMSTYQCHKKHYCSQRNLGRPASDRKQDSPQFGMTAVPPLGLAGSMSAASLQLATLGHNGLLFSQGHPIAPGDAGALPAGAALIPGGQPAMILTAPVMTANGITSMAIPLTTVLQSTAVLQSIQAAAAAAGVRAPVSPPVSTTSSRKSSSPQKLDTASPRSAAPEEAHQSKSPKRAYSSDVGSSKELPLDLSTKKSDTDGSSGPPDRKIKKEKEEAKSPVSSAPSATGCSPRRSSSAEGFPCGSAAAPAKAPSTPTPTSLSGLPPHLLTPSLLQPFMPLPSLAALPIKSPFGGIPPGSSKCTDCNIIFYKHENYLIHKQHYCSERKKLRPMSTATSGAVSPRAADSSAGVKLEPSSTATSTPEPGGRPSSVASPGREGASSSQPHYLSSTPVKPLASTHTEEVYYKFFCVPCKIKFSSASNLKAHKDYYCPHGKNSEHSIIAQRPSGEIISGGGGGEVEQQPSPGSNDSSPSPGQYCCPQCRGTFTSSRLLKLHLCSAEVAQASVLKCSHCDYLTHTDKRLAEHMKVHNPTSAYRCTLCGYRGNTVRGMRMHGKTHTDKGEDFTDDHMLEFQEPPLVPIQTNSHFKATQGPFTLEAELLRLKNEPYKRRRSRKAYEKVDLLVRLDDPQSCHMCGECFPDHPTLVDHLRLHVNQQTGGGHLLPCNQCGFLPRSPEEMHTHMEVSHGMLVPREEKENLPQSPPPSSHRHGSAQPESEKKSPVHVKDEPLDSDCEGREGEGSSAALDGRRTDDGGSPPATHSLSKGGPDHSTDDSSPCTDRPDSETEWRQEEEMDVGKNCSQGESGAVRVKTEPEVLDGDEDSYNDPPLPITFAAPASSPSSQLPASDSLPSSPHQRLCRDTPPSPPSTGTGRHSPAPSSPPPVSTPIPTPSSVKVEPDLSHSAGHVIFPRFFVHSPLAMGATASQDMKGLQGGGGSGEGGAVPYCKNCDISFTYHSTFVAHKKYYCTERNGLPPSATA